jgi:hypothetical protein
MTAAVFQSPGDQPRASAKRDRAQPGVSTGECTHCGGQNLPMTGRDIDRHHPRRVKGRRLGMPVTRVATDEGWCPGSLHPAVAGSVEKVPDAKRPYRGNRMAANRRVDIVRRDGAA